MSQSVLVKRGVMSHPLLDGELSQEVGHPLRVVRHDFGHFDVLVELGLPRPVVKPRRAAPELGLDLELFQSGPDHLELARLVAAAVGQQAVSVGDGVHLVRVIVEKLQLHVNFVVFLSSRKLYF